MTAMTKHKQALMKEWQKRNNYYSEQKRIRAQTNGTKNPPYLIRVIDQLGLADPIWASIDSSGSGLRMAKSVIQVSSLGQGTTKR